MGKLNEFLDRQVAGYFRAGHEESFPWSDRGRHVWYALLVNEATGIERYGFTAAISQKRLLISALESLESSDNALLLGIWTGAHRTDLFELDLSKAKLYLSAAVNEN